MHDHEDHQHDPATFSWEDCYSGTLDDVEPPDALVLETALALSPGRSLDVGCGAGGLMLALAKRGFDVAGIDAANKAIGAARKLMKKHELTAKLETADATSWRPDTAYDLVTNCFALPGTRAGQARALAMMKDALAPGGTVILKEFDAGMKKHGGPFSSFHHPTLAEIETAFEGLTVVRSEIIDTPVHHHAGDDHAHEKWSAIIFVGHKPE